jgi:hypothetical protein
MAFERKVLKLAPSGFNFDLPADQVAITEFNSGVNVTFRNGIPTRCSGYARVYQTPIATPEYLLNARTELTNFWLYPCRSVVGVLDGAAHFDISPLVPLIPTTERNQWTGDVLNNIPVINNDLNIPYFWDLVTSSKVQPLPGWPANTFCKAMRSFKYHLIAMNIRDPSGQYGDLILWSNAAEPGAVPNSWTPLPDNEAGNALLTDTTGDIIDGFALRDQFIIFKNTSMYSLQYIGGNDVFSIRKINDTSGMLTRNCAANLHGITVILSNNDVVVLDGNEARSIIDKKMRDTLFSFLDPVHFVNSYLVADQANNEVWVCVPTIGQIEPNLAFVWSGDTNDWGLRVIPNATFIARGIVKENSGVPTWAGSTETWEAAIGIWDSANFEAAIETLLMANGIGGSPKLFSIDAATTDDGETIYAEMSKLALDMGLPQYLKVLKRVWPRVSASPGTELSIRCGSHNAPDDPVTWSDPVPFIVGQDQKIDSFANGRYLAVSISSLSIPVWQMTGFDVEYSLGGAF